MDLSDASNPSQSHKVDIISDICFSLVFAVCFVLLLAMSIYNFCHFKNMINLPNILVVVLLLTTLLSKFAVHSPLNRPAALPSLLVARLGSRY